MSDTKSVQDVEDLIATMPEGHPSRDYLRLLYRAATEGYPIGVLETAVEAEALSDWEACMALSRDLEVERITEIRERLCSASPLIQRHGSRKGKATYTLHPGLVDGEKQAPKEQSGADQLNAFE